MASPKIEVVFFYDPSTGAPMTGLTPTFSVYKDDLGADKTPPGISEVGGGAYKFTVTVASERGVVYVVDGGASAAPRYQARYVRGEDWNADNADVPASTLDSKLTDLHDEAFGKWEIRTVGPDANRIIFYRPNGSVLAKFDLADAAGAATFINPFKRTPT